MITSYDIIHAVIKTEKSAAMEKDNKYVFQVVSFANKIGIKRAVEEIYNVKVDNVKTLVVPGKRKRVRQDFGYTTPWKKAIVTLKEGQKIVVT